MRLDVRWNALEKVERKKKHVKKRMRNTDHIFEISERSTGEATFQWLMRRRCVAHDWICFTSTLSRFAGRQCNWLSGWRVNSVTRDVCQSYKNLAETCRRRWVMTVQFINKSNKCIVFSCLCEILQDDVAKKFDLCKSFLCQSTEIRFELAAFVLNCCVKKKCNLEHRTMMREKQFVIKKSLNS